MKQLRSNLKTSDSDLTVDNSVFEVKPTGLKDPEKEIIRKRHTLQKSKYLKPFEYGWKREIVEGLTTRVYYHTPSGEKFRSKRELSTILEGTELTPDNFFFSRRPLGLNNPEKEIIRRSKKKQYLNTEKVAESVNDDFPSDDSVSPEPSSQVLPIITDPKYLKPFRYGWKRVVVKGLPKTRKKKAIVYYYRVGGKKIYDKAPLAKILKNRGLTPDHFIFKGVSLGLNDPEKEIIQEFNAELCQRKKKRKQINLTDPKFLKPFEYGWKREVVDRSSSGNPDYAFYHSPNGKKVYSIGKLSNILTTNDLTHRNFVFLGKPIGLNDPEKEIIRKIHKVDISVYLKPFQYGWKREIVEGCGKNVFYYTPAGEKINSKRELSTILKGTELTPDNFLFSRRPLGLNDPEKEIIQKSKKRKTTETSDTELPSISNNSAPEGIETKISSKTVLKKRKVSETPELVVDSNDLGFESPDEEESMEVETERPIPPQKSKITKNPKHSNDVLPIVTNSKYLKPFRYGWKRVIVTRLPKSWRKKAFVYYYKVGGRKFYKKARLARILKDSELNPDHFIFRGVSLGLNDPEKEKIQVFSGGLCERKEKVIKQANMTDPKFLKPFEYGWKREVVKSSCKEHAGYAFYYTPKGKAVYTKQGLFHNLRTNDLNVDNFLFLGKPIGLNDPEKEIIRKKRKRRMTEISGTELPSISKTDNSALEGMIEHRVLCDDQNKDKEDAGGPLGLNNNPAINKRSIRNPRYLKPFQYGWKREVVEGRGENVCYHTPAGKKIRSKWELFQILEGTELTPDDFVFGRRPLGLKDPEKEIIRKPSKGCYVKTGKVTEPSESDDHDFPLNDSNDIDSILPAEEESIEVETERPIPPQKSKMTQIPKPSSEVLPIITNSKYLKPFRYGWKRVVVKGLPKSRKKKPFVYYRIGEKKFWKKTQLAKILKDSELTPDHFIFSRILLGLNDPEKEIIQVEQADMTDPKFLKPFEYGWKREVVEKNSKGHAGYAFYYTPKGKRVYSKRGFGNILKNSGLTTRNFVFLGKPIGLNDPEKEIIRKREKRKMTETSDSELPSISNNNNFASEGIETKISSKIVGEEGYLKRRKVSETPESVDDDFPLDDSDDLGPKSSDEEVETERPIPMDSVTFIQKTEEPKFSSLQSVSYIYNTLLQVFRYLQSKDLLRAGCVCTMWRDIANHPSLWRTVRIKYERVRNFQKLADCLEKHGTVHLDLRKMLLPSTSETDGMWREFSIVIEQVRTLRKIELSRCPGWVVEQLAVQNKNLEVINAVTTRGESVSLDALSSLKNLKEFHLTSPGDLTLSSDITPIEKSTMLIRLSLTSIKGLNIMNLGVIAVLVRLESLDLGECVDFPKSFAQDILVKLKKLKKLRLEKGQGKCCTIEILVAVKRMPQLEQLELVNFDIKTGFDVALGDCKNIKKLLIIPVYISHTATINQIVLEGVLQLHSTLSHFIWFVTLELLRATRFFVDDKEDCIPLLKPLPLITDKENNVSSTHNPTQLEILSLATFQELLIKSLPTSKVRILKIPFRATWWQGFNCAVDW